MTKRRQSATGLRPSKLCRLLFFIVTLKFTLLGSLILDPSLPPGLQTLLPDFLSSGSASGVARAAPDQSPAAPPPVDATLPDAGMRRQPPGVASHVGTPGAAPGVVSPGKEDGADAALPSIGANRQQNGRQPAASSPMQPDIRDSLAKRQEDLARKEQELKVLENELNSRLERMQLLENRLSEMIKEAEGTQDAKFRHLVDMLSNMKARQAAVVLETLDRKVSVKVLAGMRGRQAGEILTYVKPEIAAKLTEALARMRLPME
jgi:flagellar motility protein MotE (MotC chaperone)